MLLHTLDIKSRIVGMKRIYIESLGCAKNQVDSEILYTYAMENGYIKTDDPMKASVIVVNSCGFIEDAKTESIETTFGFRQRYPHSKIILAGCMAQRYAEDMDLPEVDAIFGNHDLSKFPEILKKVEAGMRPVETPESPCNPYDERDDRAVSLSLPGSSFLKISEGCDHRCAYCAIPLIRGPLRSRPMDRIVEEAERLIAGGTYEINIIAQDLGNYGTDFPDHKSHFVELMDRLSSLEGNFVLRMLYIHPDTFPKGLLELCQQRPKILPYFDIPFQHANEKVLRGMGRTGNVRKYVDMVKHIREMLPGAVVRSTLMLGFPGEDDEAFEDLKTFVREAELDWMGSFLYSREEDTPAYDMRGEEEHNEAHERARKYQDELVPIQDEISERRAHSFVGGEYTALIEERIEGESLAFGRIYSQAPEVDGITVVQGENLKPGDIVRVKIRKNMCFDLEGEVVR